MTSEQIEIELRHLATKEDLASLKVGITEQLIASERATRGLIFGAYAAIFGAYAAIFGTYALIIASVFINHFWK